MIPAGVGLTLWRSKRFDLALEYSKELLTTERPPLVNLHLWPTEDTERYVDGVRVMLPDTEIWLSPGCNGLADNSLADIKAQGKAWGKRAEKQGAKCLLLNLEGSSLPGYPGWTSDDPAKLAQLGERAHALVDSIADAAPSLTIGLTSHDCPDWHHLPWDVLLGERSPVKIHAPQLYPGIKRPGCTLAAARGRWSLATSQWAKWVARGLVRADLGPGGAGWVTYGQGWGHSVGASLWLLDQAPRSLMWASPSRLWLEGRVALRTTLRLRRELGEGAGVIARHQAHRHLAVDGLPGPVTLGSLGLTQLPPA